MLISRIPRVFYADEINYSRSSMKSLIFSQLLRS